MTHPPHHPLGATQCQWHRPVSATWRSTKYMLPPPSQILPGSLSSCCEEVEKRTRIDPRNGKPMPEQANAKAVCNTYKKQQTPGSAPATAPAQQQQQGKEKKAGDGSSRKYFIFKGFGELMGYQWCRAVFVRCRGGAGNGTATTADILSFRPCSLSILHFSQLLCLRPTAHADHQAPNPNPIRQDFFCGAQAISFAKQ